MVAFGDASHLESIVIVVVVVIVSIIVVIIIISIIVVVVVVVVIIIVIVLVVLDASGAAVPGTDQHRNPSSAGESERTYSS